MKVEGDYWKDGYALLKGLLAPEIGRAFVRQLNADFDKQGGGIRKMARRQPLTNRPTVEIYGFDYQPMLAFLWGLTPIVAQAVGRDLLPTYDYFRVYREGDVCKVHSDRPSCEHSLSLTLDYSDGVPWDLELGHERIRAPLDRPHDDFGGAAHSALTMEPGDAVLYQGVHHLHGRTRPNPNGWSAHLFLHWVDREGPFAVCAFDGNQEMTRPANLSFR